MELTEEQLNHLRQLVEDEIKKLKDILSDSESYSKPVSLDNPIGRVSRIDAIQQQTIAKDNFEKSKVRLKRLEACLKNFETGEYGYCASCEESIHFGRLKVYPETSLCIRCQIKLDRR